MKASELRKALAALIIEHGDLDVTMSICENDVDLSMITSNFDPVDVVGVNLLGLYTVLHPEVRRCFELRSPDSMT